MLIKIAFRNIFRNKRRSVLTMAAITLSIGMLIFGYSYFDGVIHNIIEDSLKTNGDIRIIHPEYEIKERMLSLGVPVEEYTKIRDIAQNQKYVNTASGRIKFGSFIDFKESQERAVGIGIDPLREKTILNIEKNIIEGRNCNPGLKETVIGKELRRRLNIQIGDTMTVYTSTASMSFTGVNLVVVGVFDLFLIDLNKMYFLPLLTAQELLDMENMVTEILLSTSNYNKAAEFAAEMRNIPEIAEVHKIQAWMEIGLLSNMYPMLKSVFALLSGLFLIVAVMVIANTMLMSVLERTYEIGLLMSMGIKRFEIMILFLWEGAFLGILGGLSGSFFGCISGLYLQHYGITIGKLTEGFPIPFRQVIYGQLTIQSVLTAFILGVVVSVIAAFLPALKGARMQPGKAMRII